MRRDDVLPAFNSRRQKNASACAGTAADSAAIRLPAWPRRRGTPKQRADLHERERQQRADQHIAIDICAGTNDDDRVFRHHNIRRSISFAFKTDESTGDHR
jgi:hypothetical protein